MPRLAPAPPAPPNPDVAAGHQRKIAYFMVDALGVESVADAGQAAKPGHEKSDTVGLPIAEALSTNLTDWASTGGCRRSSRSGGTHLGIVKEHECKNILIPHKKSKNKPLADEQKSANKHFASERILVLRGFLWGSGRLEGFCRNHRYWNNISPLLTS